jgi:hypothetical protein
MEVSMEPKDWISIVAVLISLVALVISLRNRKLDIDRQKKLRIQTQVWEIINTPTGYRTILALDDSDGKTAERIKYLKKTAEQLKIAGAPELAKQLENLLDETRWSSADQKIIRDRNDFQKAISEFMKPI